MATQTTGQDLLQVIAVILSQSSQTTRQNLLRVITFILSQSSLFLSFVAALMYPPRSPQ